MAASDCFWICAATWRIRLGTISTRLGSNQSECPWSIASFRNAAGLRHEKLTCFGSFGLDLQTAGPITLLQPDQTATSKWRFGRNDRRPGAGHANANANAAGPRTSARTEQDHSHCQHFAVQESESYCFGRWQIA